jgi:hypothetical protein
MRSAFSLPVVGEIRDDERRLDDPGTGGIAKKRKVPAYPQIAGKDEDENDSREQLKEAEIGSNGQQTIFTSNFRLARSKAAKACSFRKALFLRRKAALVTLYLDAQSALIAGTAHLGTKQPPLPDVPTFEKLIPSIEDIGVANWAPDEPGWRNDWKTEKTIQPKMLEEWRSAFSAKRRVRASRQPINRGGWAPEGSFEFDSLCKGELLSKE